MIINVRNISRNEFTTINDTPILNYPVPNIKEKEYQIKQEEITRTSHTYISIYGTQSFESKKPRITRSLWYPGLQLQFDDISPKTNFNFEKPFSSEQASIIINFSNHIHFLSDQMTIIVHCFAGISRSAAVAKWINDFFNLGIKRFENHPSYNHFVYDTLIKESGIRNQESYPEKYFFKTT